MTNLCKREIFLSKEIVIQHVLEDKQMDRILSMLQWKIEEIRSFVEYVHCWWNIVDELNRSFSELLRE